MIIDICETNLKHKDTIRNLYQFYLYDTSAEEREDVNCDGLYDFAEEYFSRYWVDDGWSAHLILADNEVAGFLLIETSDIFPGTKEFADLFIMKKYRRHGIAHKVVRKFLSERRHPWLVVVFHCSKKAQEFWNKQFSIPELSDVEMVRHPDFDSANLYLLQKNFL